MHASEFHQNAIVPPMAGPKPADDPIPVATTKDEPTEAPTALDANAVLAEAPTADRSAILVDFLHPRSEGAEPTPPPPPPVAAKPAAKPVSHKSHRVAVISASVIVALMLVGGTYAYISYSKDKSSVAVTPPPPTTPPAAPAPTPPAVTPPAANVTTPTTTPTKDHPQAVTVTSKSGLWIRSTPDSSNKSNIISWIPNGGSVSVDEVGDFWWHGTYKGVTGYFAANYTQ